MSPILTRAELEARLAARARPLLDHPSPGGWLGAEVDRQVSAADDIRRRLIEKGLDHAGEKVRVDHARAQVRGKAKADFGRCG